MTSEHNTGRRLILRVGSEWNNKFVVTVPNYHGSLCVGPELLDALDAELARRYGACRQTSFDHVEILGVER